MISVVFKALEIFINNFAELNRYSGLLYNIKCV